KQVTGGTGFIGFHILTQLLDKGYFVKAAARGPKVNILKKALSVNYGEKFEVIEVPDVSSGDLSQHLKGVDAIIHSAAPLPGRVDPETALRISIDGSLHIIREAVKANVPRVVTTSSVVSYPTPVGPFGVDDWNAITKEEAIASGVPFHVYVAEKKYSDMAVVEFAESHPEIDLTLIGPPFNFGPIAPGFELLISEPNLSALSTNEYLYALLRPSPTTFPSLPGAIDVRDVARAHVLALESRPSSEVGRKRLAICSPYQSSYKDALAIIAKERPELKDRLADGSHAPEWPSYTLPLNWERLEHVLGLKADSFIAWEKTVLDAVDSLLLIEGQWKEKGFKVPV
ncbi:NAD(P)-binding protein, partial [Guyanagaster necrorhizus]